MPSNGPALARAEGELYRIGCCVIMTETGR